MVFFFFFTFELKALYFQTGFSQEHRGRYDIKESNLMQYKEQQKSNAIFIKKHFLSVRQDSWILKSEPYLLNLAIWHWMKSKDDWYCVFNTTQCTARTVRFSKKSPWSVFFRSEMSLICHKITVKCRWNFHRENLQIRT